MFPDILLEDSKLRRGPEIFALLRNFFNEEHRWTGVRGFFLIGDKNTQIMKKIENLTKSFLCNENSCLQQKYSKIECLIIEFLLEFSHQESAQKATISIYDGKEKEKEGVLQNT